MLDDAPLDAPPDAAPDAPHRRAARPATWPALPFEECRPTLETLHLWTQIVGKVRLERTPWINHSWHVPLYVTPRGLGTSSIPAQGRMFDMEMDFHRGRLAVTVSDGTSAAVELRDRTVSDFYEEVMDRLAGLGLATDINTTPSEIEGGIPFELDHTHGAYDPEVARRFWQALIATFPVFQAFRARFRGKASPVHFYWGSFDLAISRFSGAPAPEHPGGIPALPDWIAREAYDREVSSLGFWPGDARTGGAIFYSYAYPAPEGFAAADIGGGAHFDERLGEFVLPYVAVRDAGDPEGLLMGFAQRTYEAAAELGHWDRDALEWPGGAAGPPERRWP